MTKRKPMTAAELMAQLRSDPNFLNREADEERKRLEYEQELRQAERPLLHDLQASGITVNSVWELVNAPNVYQHALPILIDHLQREYPQRVREGIARALAVPEAIEFWDTLVRLFENESDSTTTGVKWALACALAEAANDDTTEDVIRLVTDKRHGPNRLILVRSLARSTNNRVRSVLMDLVDDPDAGREAQKALKNFTRRHGLFRARNAILTKPQTLAELSIQLDATAVELLLSQISSFVPGLTLTEVGKICRRVAKSQKDDAWEFHYGKDYSSDSVPLIIHIIMDEDDVVDLHFFTKPPLTTEIQRVIDDFLEEDQM